MRAFAMFTVGWGANQFAPMLIVYRHELRLSEGGVAGADRVLARVAAVPYLMAGLGGLAGQAGAFGVLAVAVALLAVGMAGYAVWLGRARSKAAGSERAVAGRRYAPAPGSSHDRSRAG